MYNGFLFQRPLRKCSDLERVLLAHPRGPGHAAEEPVQTGSQRQIGADEGGGNCEGFELQSIYVRKIFMSFFGKSR